MDPNFVQTSISSFKENFDQHHKNFFFTIKRVLKASHPYRGNHLKSKSLHIKSDKGEAKTVKAKDNYLKANMNISNQTRSINNNNDLVTMNYFKHMVNNNTLSNNSYSANNRKTKGRQSKNRKNRDSQVIRSIPSEMPNVESEGKIESIREISDRREGFADKILQESKEILGNREDFDFTEKNDIHEKTLNFLQRENAVLKQENENLKQKIESLMEENEDLRRNMKETIEAEIGDQKAQIQAVIEQYKSFIAKLMNDKKELSLNCERLLREANENKRIYSENDVEIIKQYESKSTENTTRFMGEIDNLNAKIKELTSKNTVFKENPTEKRILNEKIAELESELRNYREKIDVINEQYIQKMVQKEEEFYKSYNSLEYQVKEALQKKDEVIRQLNTLLAKNQ